MEHTRTSSSQLSNKNGPTYDGGLVELTANPMQNPPTASKDEDLQQAKEEAKNDTALDGVENAADWPVALVRGLEEKTGWEEYLDFSAAAMLSPEVKPKLKGLERASSLAFDFHKWFHVIYDCGCVLVREADAQLLSFSDRAEYLASDPQERGIGACEVSDPETV